ncbi:hypothetical protein [Rubrivirga sp.]|uniref:hypothetical protein n=1 Tax=Rubrivirga sp. TaxID=1885344 RepID=UPI003C70EA75
MARKKRRSASKTTRSSTSRSVTTMPFDGINYRLLLGAIGLIVLGYTVMLVDNRLSDNPVDSVFSLWVAPLLLLAGYVGVAGAVLWGVPRDVAPDLEVEPDVVVVDARS